MAKKKRVKPKKTCCASKPRCKRCPVRLLAEGKLDPAEAREIFQKARNRKQAKKAKVEIPG